MTVFFKWFRLKNKIDLESDLPVENQWTQLKKNCKKPPRVSTHVKKCSIYELLT